jgi:hypothetical protein
VYDVYLTNGELGIENGELNVECRIMNGELRNIEVKRHK